MNNSKSVKQEVQEWIDARKQEGKWFTTCKMKFHRYRKNCGSSYMYQTNIGPGEDPYIRVEKYDYENCMFSIEEVDEVEEVDGKGVSIVCFDDEKIILWFGPVNDVSVTGRNYEYTIFAVEPFVDRFSRKIDKNDWRNLSIGKNGVFAIYHNGEFSARESIIDEFIDEFEEEGFDYMNLLELLSIENLPKRLAKHVDCSEIEDCDDTAYIYTTDLPMEKLKPILIAECKKYLKKLKKANE